MTQNEIRRLARAVAEELAILQDEVMNTKKAAEYLGCSVRAVQDRVARNRIPCHRRGGKIYFSKQELTKYYLQDDSGTRVL